ncbi:MAG: L-rhamnose/proton symporter RhaT [Terracidiphilus sp.]
MRSILGGIGWHMLGAAMAASFYIPIEKVRKWSWESTWAFAGLFSWVLAPVGVALVLLPNFHSFYASMGWPVLIRVALFGALWGVGGITYGLTMRHLGLALGIGIAQGINLMVGTVLPPLVEGQGHALFATRSGLITMGGVVVALAGVAVVTWAGHMKEVQKKGHLDEFNVALGLALAILCGFSSSGMSFGIAAARPMEQAALHLGVKPLYAALPAYVLIMGAGALVNWSYCGFRLWTLKHNPLKDLHLPGSELARNGALAATGGLMWYLQFFFYAWGAANIARRLSYVNWMLHMSGYVLFGGVLGLALGEWKGVGSRPMRLLWAGILAIIAAANLVGLGMAT